MSRATNGKHMNSTNTNKAEAARKEKGLGTAGKTPAVRMGNIYFQPGELHAATAASHVAGFRVPVFINHVAFVNASTAGKGGMVRLMRAAHQGLARALRTQTNTRHSAFSMFAHGVRCEFSLNRAETNSGRAALVICAQ